MRSSGHRLKFVRRVGGLSPLAAAVMGVVGLLRPGVAASTLTWDASGTSPIDPADGGGAWTAGTGSNWSNGSVDLPWNNANGDTAVFGHGYGAAGTVSLGSDITAGGLTFNAAGSGGYLIDANGHQLTLSPGAGITLNAGVEIDNNLAGTGIVSGMGTLTLGGTADNFGLGLTVNSGTVILAKKPSSDSPDIHAVGGGGLTIGGGGFVQLAGTGNAQIYSGSTVSINSGALDLNGESQNLVNALNLAGSGILGGGALMNGAAAASSLNASVALTNNASIGVSQSGGSLMISNAITAAAGNFGITKVGFGNLILNGANTYGGVTTINCGTLTLTGSGTLINTAGIIVYGTGGSVAPPFGTVAPESMLQVDDNVNPPASLVGDHFGTTPITISGGSYFYHARSGGSVDTLGSLSIPTGATIIAQPQSGTADVSITNLTLGPTATVTFRGQYSPLGTTATPDTGKVHIANLNGTPTVDGGGNATINVNGIMGGWATTVSYNNGGTGVTDFATYDPVSGVKAVTYSTAANVMAAAPTDNYNAPSADSVTASLTINSLNSSDSASYGDFQIAQAATLTLNSGGLIMGGPNHWIKGDSTGNGSLTAGPGSVVGGKGNLFVTVNDGGTDYRISGVTVVDNAATATPVTLVKGGAGQLVLDAVNTYSGGTIINGGTLKITNVNALGSNPSVTINPGGTFDFGGVQTDHGGFNAVISGPGNAGYGVIYNTDGNGSYLTGFDHIQLAGNATVGGPAGRWDFGRDRDTTKFPSALDGGGFNLTKIGSDFVGVIGPMTNLASLTINGGQIDAEDNNGYGTDTHNNPTPVVVNSGGTASAWGGRSFANAFTLNGGRLMEDQGSYTDIRTGAIVINGGGTFDAASAGNTLQFFGGSITGGGTLVMNGAGTVLLGGNPGTGQLSETVALGAGSLIDVQSGTTRNEWGNSAWGGNLAGLQVEAGAAYDTWDGDTTVGALNGAGNLNKGWTGTNAITFGVNNGSGSFTGTITNVTSANAGAGATGNLNLVKRGNGTQAFSGTNTYSGTTTIAGGMLLANNTSGSATGSGAVFVGDSSGANGFAGRLAGTGSVAGPVTVYNGSTLSAGNGATITSGPLIGSTGTLTLNSASGNTLNNGSNYLWKINDPGNAASGGGTGAGVSGGAVGWDNLVFSSLTVASGSVVDVIPLSVGAGAGGAMTNFNPSGNYKWVIATVPAGYGSTLAAYPVQPFALDTNALSAFAARNNANAALFSIGEDPGDVFVQYNGAPEPTSLTLLGLGAAGLLLRRRKRNHGAGA